MGGPQSLSANPSPTPGYFPDPSYLDSASLEPVESMASDTCFSDGYFGQTRLTEVFDSTGAWLSNPVLVNKFIKPFANGVCWTSPDDSKSQEPPKPEYSELSRINTSCDGRGLHRVTVICPPEEGEDQEVATTLEGPFQVQTSVLESDQMLVKSHHLTGYVDGKATTIRGVEVTPRSLMGRIKLWCHETFGT